MGNIPNEIDEDQKLKRIRIIAPVLYEEIVAMEAEIYGELNDRMMDIGLVKDLILDYNEKEARRMFDNLVKQKKKPSR